MTVVSVCSISDMENKKKNYLFRIGPVVFLPKDEKKAPPYLDGKESNRNVFRTILTVLYGFYSFLLIYRFELGDFLAEGDTEITFIIFCIPGLFSLIDLHLTWIEKKTGIARSSFTHTVIYMEWLVSLVFYSIYLYHYLIKSI
jgi:hypothetical protein